MNKNVILYGLIAGFIASVGIASMAFGGTIDFENSMLVAYASMLLAFSLIFVAVKKQRDAQGGAITFGKAFVTGLYITLIASTIYVATWLVCYYFFIPDFMDQYAEFSLSQLRAEGASEAAIAAKQQEMEVFREFYKNPFFNILMTYTEILPIGLLLSLISAAVLKKKPQQLN
ncbi:MAG: DUF4199 domain-containing protein [Flavobacterium sp.]|nr:MAG: DUF4199 domain-containing protein [Flavobacterium sp.]